MAYNLYGVLTFNTATFLPLGTLIYLNGLIKKFFLFLLYTLKSDVCAQILPLPIAQT